MTDAGRSLSGKERATLLLKVADLIDRDRERIARVETLEAGKPIAQARAEIEGAADLWRYAAALARTLSRRQPQQPRARHARRWC